MSEVTEILAAIEHGDEQATDELLRIVYNELRQIAAAKLSYEAPGQTLQTTALVHEAFLRMLGGPGHAPTGEASDTPAASLDKTEIASNTTWHSRGHFFAAAAEAMRRILIDHARRKKRLKRGGNRDRLELEQVDLSIPAPAIDLIALDEALVKLEAEDETKANVVKLRYFAGLTIEQAAAALGVSEPTVKRHWYYARAWLRREIGKGDE